MKPVLEELVLLEVPMQVFKEDSEGQVHGGKTGLMQQMKT